MYLRKFKNVFALNFSGNSLSEENDYKHFVIAFFPKLKYLDYRYVNSEIVSILFNSNIIIFTTYLEKCKSAYFAQKKQALEKFHIEVQKLSSEDEQREKEAEAVKARQAELQLHKVRAFVHVDLTQRCLQQIYSHYFIGRVCGIIKWVFSI